MRQAHSRWACERRSKSFLFGSGFSAGDVVLVVTDGVTESATFLMAPDARLASLLLGAAEFGAQHVVDVVFDAVHESSNAPRDDMLAVAIERKC